MSGKGPFIDDDKTSVEFASYEEAAVVVGAPTEKVSPLGYHVGSITVVFLVRLLVCYIQLTVLIHYRRTSAE